MNKILSKFADEINKEELIDVMNESCFKSYQLR